MSLAGLLNQEVQIKARTGTTYTGDPGVCRPGHLPRPNSPTNRGGFLKPRPGLNRVVIWPGSRSQ